MTSLKPMENSLLNKAASEETALFNAVLNAVPFLKAKAAELARAD